MNYKFGPYILAGGRRELRKAGVQVSIQPKAFDLLLFLIENRGRAVKKDEIFDAIWPDLHISETALTRCIMKARHAVGDDADRQSVIKTVHGHGYLFALNVSEQSEEETARDAVTRRLSWLSTRAVMTAAAGCVALLFAVFASLSVRSGNVATDDFRIAVLPVENATGDPELEWTEIGLMSLVDNYLSDERDLATVSSVDVLRYVSHYPESHESVEDDDQTVRILAEKLLKSEGATHVVSAELTRDGELYQIKYLITYPQGVQTSFTLLGDGPVPLGRQFGGSVASTLEKSDTIQVKQIISEDPFVEEAFARARALQLDGKDEDALKLFDVALQENANNFSPRYYRAISKRNQGNNDEAEQEFLAIIETLDADAEPDKADSVHNALGYLYYSIGDFDTAETFYEKAMAYAKLSGDPSRIADGYRSLGGIADEREDFETAREYYQNALNEYLAIGISPPPSRLLSSFAILEARTGNYEAAARYFEMDIEKDRSVGDMRSIMISLGNISYLYYSMGEWEKSDAYYSEAVELSRRLEDPMRTAFNLIRWAKLKTEAGHFDDAEAMNIQAEALVKELNNPRMEFFLLKNIGLLEYHRGEYNDAMKVFSQWRDVDRQLSKFDDVLHSTIPIARVKFSLGDSEEALTDAEAYLRELESKEKEPSIEALELIFDIKSDQGLQQQAVGYIEDAIEVAEAGGHGLDIARLASRLGLVMLERGDLDRAEELFLKAQSNDPDMASVLKLEAELLYTNNEIRAALYRMQTAKMKAGDHWTTSDETRLLGMQ